MSWTEYSIPLADSGPDLATKQVKARKVKRYHKWKRDCMVRDGKTCQKCNGRSGDRSLTVHHIESYEEYPDLRVDLDNGITLCMTCHRAYHREMGRMPTLDGLVSWLGFRPGFTFNLESKKTKPRPG